MLKALRSFFDARGFTEVETPIRIPVPAQELHIDAEPSGDFYLRTSPELHMKRMLAAGLEKIYQVGPCFRRGERGPLHHPEYSMLEWYRVGADYRNILEDTRELIADVATAVTGRAVISYRGNTIDLGGEWTVQTVQDAFTVHAGWDPVSGYDADRFDLDLVEKVEPALSAASPTVLIDYPAEAAALSRRKAGSPGLAERWELYIGGLELANAYSELTDAEEQRQRFLACGKQRISMGKTDYGLDEPFMASLDTLPPCGGIALGVDRLVMLLCDAASLDAVLPFRD